MFKKTFHAWPLTTDVEHGTIELKYSNITHNSTFKNLFLPFCS